MLKNILLIIFLIINLILIKAPPPMNEFILEYEYYSLNDVVMNHMLPNMLGKLNKI